MRSRKRPPNIIFVMADQLGACHLGAYGSPVPSTPTLDRLAARGVRFERYYTSVAVCAPSRATILTGLSPEAHGLTQNNLELSATNRTYAHALRSVGYRLGCFGKLHQTSMALPPPEDARWLGFDEAQLTEDPRQGAWLEWIRSEHPEHYQAALATSWPVPYIRGEAKRKWQRAFDKVLKPRREASPWGLMYPSPLPPELEQTTWITDCSLDFMKLHLQGSPEQPFFCHISYVAPHDPYAPPEPYSSMFAPADMPRAIPAQWEGRGSRTLEQKQRFAGFDKIAHGAEAIAQLRAYYHGSLRQIDDQLERVETFVTENNLWADTLIVFTTDHGEMLGDHALITKGVAHYDAGVRCPLIVCGANVTPGSVSERLTCSLDFTPSFCEWAGVPDPWPLEGYSFAAACRGGAETLERAEVTIEADYVPELHPSVRSIVTEDGWRLSVFDEPGYGEMFDLRADPDEQSNLYFDPAFSHKRQELFERHARAFMRRASVQQLRALPRVEGRAQRVAAGLELRDDILPTRDA